MGRRVHTVRPLDLIVNSVPVLTLTSTSVPFPLIFLLLVKTRSVAANHERFARLNCSIQNWCGEHRRLAYPSMPAPDRQDP